MFSGSASISNNLTKATYEAPVEDKLNISRHLFEKFVNKGDEFKGITYFKAVELLKEWSASTGVKPPLMNEQEISDWAATQRFAS